MHRYAWLEFEGGIWHFLTDPFAHPKESRRRWTDAVRAFDDLLEEGWSVVRAYPESISTNGPDGDKVVGYGLTRQIH